MDYFLICSTRPCLTESLLGTCGYSECPFFHSPALVASRIARGCPPPRFCSETNSPIVAAKQPRIAPPARSLSPRKTLRQRRRMSFALHPKKAAIVRFDARIGKASPQFAAVSTSASSEGSSAPVTKPTDVCDICARADVVSSNLVRPSDEALRPFDSLFGYLVRIGSFRDSIISTW